MGFAMLSHPFSFCPGSGRLGLDLPAPPQHLPGLGGSLASEIVALGAAVASIEDRKPLLHVVDCPFYIGRLPEDPRQHAVIQVLGALKLGAEACCCGVLTGGVEAFVAHVIAD